MYYNKCPTVFIFPLLLLIALYFVNPVISTENQTLDQSNSIQESVLPIDSWTYDYSLKHNEVYTWNVTTFTINGENILTPSEQSPIVEGSKITITLKEDLSNVNILQYIANNFSEPFPIEYRVDDQIFDAGLLFLEYMYPTYIIFTNMTRINLFDLDRPEFREEISFIGRYEGSNYIIEIDEYYSRRIIIRDTITGILQKYIMNYRSGIIEYDYLGKKDVIMTMESHTNVSSLLEINEKYDFIELIPPLLIVATISKISKRVVHKWII